MPQPGPQSRAGTARLGAVYVCAQVDRDSSPGQAELWCVAVCQPRPNSFSLDFMKGNDSTGPRPIRGRALKNPSTIRALGAASILFAFGLSACGSPAAIQNRTLGRQAWKTRTTTNYPGPITIIRFNDLERSGLPNTGDAVKRRSPQVN